MQKSLSTLAEQVFNQLSDKVLNTQEQKQQKMINELFQGINSKTTNYSPRIIDEDEQDSQKFSKKKETPSNQTSTIQSTQISSDPEQPLSRTSSFPSQQAKSITHIQLRNLASAKFKNTCTEIEQSPFNFFHEDNQTKAKSLLRHFFCHYTQIFEQLELKAEAKRMEKQIQKLFFSNSVKIFCTLFCKGFRRIPTLMKVILKVFCVAGLISKQSFSRIGKEIKVLIGVRLDQLLIEHEKLAYQSAFKLNSTTLPSDFDIHKIKQKEKEEKLLTKKKLKAIMKQSTNQLKALHQAKILHSQVKFEPNKHKESRNETFLAKLNKSTVKTEPNITFENPIQQMNLNKRKNDNVNIKKEPSLPIQKESNRQKPSKPIKQKPSYKVVQTIILDDESESEERKTETNLKLQLLNKIKQHQKLKQKPKVDPSTQTPKISTIKPAEVIENPSNPPQKSLIFQNLTKRLSTFEIEQIKKKLKQKIPKFN